MWLGGRSAEGKIRAWEKALHSMFLKSIKSKVRWRERNQNNSQWNLERKEVVRVMRSIRPFCLSGLGAKRTGLLRIDTSDVLPTERGDLDISQQRHEAVFNDTRSWEHVKCGAWLCYCGWVAMSCVGDSQLRALCRNVSHSTILFSWRLYPPSICRRQKRSWQMCWRWRCSDKQ